MYHKFEKLLSEKNVSVYEVSRETGIATSTLSEWKKGLYKPKLDKLMILAKYFNVSINYFVDD